jgi:hypothetical protein
MAVEKSREIELEVRGLYAVGTFSLLLRYVVRIRTRGLFGLQIDDAFTFVVLVCWILLFIGTVIIYDTGTVMDFTPAEIADFDSAHIRKLEYGSKIFLMSWHP